MTLSHKPTKSRFSNKIIREVVAGKPNIVYAKGAWRVSPKPRVLFGKRDDLWTMAHRFTTALTYVRPIFPSYTPISPKEITRRNRFVLAKQKEREKIKPLHIEVRPCLPSNPT